MTSDSPAPSGSATPTDDADNLGAIVGLLTNHVELLGTIGASLNDQHDAQRARDWLDNYVRALPAPSRSGRPAGTPIALDVSAMLDAAVLALMETHAHLSKMLDGPVRTALAASREDADAMRAAVKAVEEVVGCGDHSCLFKKPSGMGTNGGCRCDRKPMVTGRLALLYRAASAFASSDTPTGSDA